MAASMRRCGVEFLNSSPSGHALDVILDTSSIMPEVINILWQLTVRALGADSRSPYFSVGFVGLVGIFGTLSALS